MLRAAGPEAESKAYLKRVKPQSLTGSTEIDKAKLAAEIEKVREQGIAQTVDQAADGAAGTAAVVRDSAGIVIGALVVAAPSSRIQKKRAELARLVREEADAISSSLGFRVAKRS